MPSRVEELFAKLASFDAEVKDIGEPWRGGLTAILSQLQLAVESAAALREVTAQAIISRADELVSAQMNVFRREIYPPCPSSASEAAVFDRKADLIRLLDLEPPVAGCVDAAVSIARDAIRDRDQLTLYCLTSGPLDYYYRARRVSPATVRERLLELTGQGAAALVFQRFVGARGVSALVAEVKQAINDPRLVEEVQQSILKPKLDLDELAMAASDGENSEELREMEEEYRRVAAMANRLGGRSN